MKQIRKRLTYANVMSSIAVFMILGGATAIAANKIGTKQLRAKSVTAGKIAKNAVTTAKLKKNAVTTAKIRNNAVTGQKINESTLGTVPTATNATNATNASNADTVNGQSAQKIFNKNMTQGQANVPIASVGGFNITATCGTNDVDVAITPPSGPGSVMFSGGEVAGANVTTFDYTSSRPGDTNGIDVDQLSGGGDATYGISTVNLATDAGTVVSGVIAYDWDTFGNTPANNCIVYGHLLVG